MIDDGSAHADVFVNGSAGAALLPPGLKAAALALARRHGRVTARIVNEEGSGGGSFSGHALRGYAALSMGEVEGAPLLAAVGHAVSLGEMLMRVQLNYKTYDDPAAAGGGGGGGGAGGFGAASAPGPVSRKVVLVEPGRYCSPRHRAPANSQEARVQRALDEQYRYRYRSS